jgi:hypothetical protein
MALFTLLIAVSVSRSRDADGSSSGVLHAGAAPLHYFLHLHKAAGSSICALASRNGEQTTSGKNCNGPSKLLGFGCSKAHAEASSRSAAVQASELHGLTFVANECTAPADVMEDAVYATVIREPLERAASHFVYDQKLGYGHYDGITDFNVFVNASSDQALRGAFFSEFATRFYSGATGPYDKPVGRAELEKAKAKLHQLDVLVDLDGDVHGAMIKLGQAYGWSSTDLPEANRVSPEAAAAQHVTLSAAAHEKLRAANPLDLELYAYAQALAAQRLANDASKARVHALVRRRWTKRDVAGDGMRLRVVA